MKAKRISVAVLAAFMLLGTISLSAVGGREDPAVQDPDAVTITWLGIWEEEVGTETLNLMEARFMELNPGIRIKRESTPFGVFYDNLVTRARANQLPDIMAMNGNWIPVFADMGAIESLEQRIIDEGIKENLSFLETYKGQEWMIDIYGGPILIFCNRRLFQEAGLDYPTTWDEYLDVARKLTDSSRGRYATAMEISLEDNAALFYWYWPLLYSAGGKALDDQGRLLYNEQPGVRALEFLSTLEREGLVLPGSLSNTQRDKRTAFASEIIAMYNEGPWGPSVLSGMEVDFEYDVIPWIQGPGPDGTGGTIAAGTGLALSSSSAHKDAAWEFIKFLTVGEGNRIWVEATNNLSNYKPHLQMDYLAEQSVLQVFADQLARSGNQGVPIVKDQVSWERRLITGIQEHLVGRKTAKQVLDEVVNAYNASLK